MILIKITLLIYYSQEKSFQEDQVDIWSQKLILKLENAIFGNSLKKEANI